MDEVVRKWDSSKETSNQTKETSNQTSPRITAYPRQTPWLKDIRQSPIQKLPNEHLGVDGEIWR